MSGRRAEFVRRLFFTDMSVDRRKLHGAYRYMISWLYPNVCPCCDKCIDYNADFCEDCRSNITLFDGGVSVPDTDGFAAYCKYDHNIDNAILKFKRDPNGNCYYAFARGIADAVKKAEFAGDIDLIVPIPITRRKMKSRGYNQTELIARELRFMLNVPYGNALVKVRDSADQKSLYGRDRAANVKGVFAVSPEFPDIRGRRLLLIDDVCTTGSTLSEAAGVLKEGGAEKVYAVAFAKTVMKDREGNGD